MNDIICEVCSRPYQYIKNKGHSKTRCNSCVVNCRKYEIMKKCFEYKGGKCQICDYNKCTRSLNFHHRDPSQKSFIISGNFCRKWETIKHELDKCDLLCANCHGELHHEEDKFKSVTWEKRKVAVFFDKVCPMCKSDFKTNKKKAIYCNDKCAKRARCNVEKPTKEELQELMNIMPMTHIGVKYGVTDNSIRKWAKKYGLI